MNTEKQPLDKNQLKGALEAVLFAAGEPLGIIQIGEMLQIVPDAVEEILLELEADYGRAERGIFIIRLEDRLQLATKKAYSDEVKKLSTVNERQTLSKGALECLAIIAYKQPVTRVEIDEIRGVSSEYVLNKLLDRGFITVAGRKDVPGRPRLYATTDEFLRQFGFENLQPFIEDESFQELLNDSEAPREEAPSPLDEYGEGMEGSQGLTRSPQ